MDRTTHSLDTVIELIDANGVILAISDNSLDEDQQSLTAAIPANYVNPLQKSLFEPDDRWTTNPRDAGMRVILPGEPGTTNLYHVRVRSSNVGPGDPASNLLDPAMVMDGITDGAYQLQLRLRELDEFAGSNVYFADIRYATIGVEVLGQPIHSPLLGEVGEDTSTNDAYVDAQPLGNLGTTDRATLSIAGFLESTSDVDFYELAVNYNSVQSNLFEALGQGIYHAAVSFDIDYADGTGGPDTQLFIFDSSGRLVLTARDSNIAEDRPGALEGADFDDLSRGSSGVQDPYLGTVELPEGTYYIAVSNNTQIAEEFNQFYETSPANALVRVEPIDALTRIAEDRIGSSGGSNIAASPEIPVLLDTAAAAVPYTLSDVTLFVSQNYGYTGTNRCNIATVDAYGGGVETTLGQFQPPVGDIAMRDDGNLFAFTIGPQSVNLPINDANIGDYLDLDTGTALPPRPWGTSATRRTRRIRPTPPTRCAALAARMQPAWACSSTP